MVNEDNKIKFDFDKISKIATDYLKINVPSEYVHGIIEDVGSMGYLYTYTTNKNNKYILLSENKLNITQASTINSDSGKFSWIANVDGVCKRGSGIDYIRKAVVDIEEKIYENSMSNINTNSKHSNIADKIRKAIYGIDVREYIAQGMELVENIKKDYDSQVINAGNSNAEIVDARAGKTTLRDRLDKIDSKFSESNKNSVFLSDYKPNIKIEERFSDIFNLYDNATIVISEDITLSKTLELPIGFNLVSFNNSKIISGNFEAVVVKEKIIGESNVNYINKNIINVESASLFKNASYIKLINSDIEMPIYDIINTNGKDVYIGEDVINISNNGLKAQLIEFSNNVISGITFVKSVPTTKKDIVVEGHGVTIKNNKFLNATGISIVGSFRSSVLKNEFENTEDSCLIYDSTNIEVAYNKFNYFSHGIRCVYPFKHYIHHNYLITGNSKEHSTGIELTGTTKGNEKVKENIVEYNFLAEINTGVPGSAIGGIHLNFHACNNQIRFNAVKRCGIGILLENNSNGNNIEGNSTCESYGEYSVGIEVNWTCNNNIITSNTSEYNNYGIRVRTGEDTQHLKVLNTIISNNKCRLNGQYGFYVNGRNIVLSNNVCEENGNDKNQNSRAEIYLIGADDIVITNNTINSNINTGIYAYNCNRIKVTTNVVNAAGIISVLFDKCNYLTIDNNVFNVNASQKRVQIRGTDSNNKATSVYVTNNVVNSNSNNGHAQLELIYIDRYYLKNNDLLNNPTQIISECTNELK
ncbi:MAG: right-handed parallel beta-helix repeat-containing protein [Fusobacterium necrophorum]|nr:right-handed parallel beta-helix repeat-containing protein [Fusobacterium necrophorum]